jgi:hypothetical protein
VTSVGYSIEDNINMDLKKCDGVMWIDFALAQANCGVHGYGTAGFVARWEFF